MILRAMALLSLTMAILPSICGQRLRAEDAAPQKFALLIAIGKYDHSFMNSPQPLDFPEEDAKALGDELKQSGYVVRPLLGKQATQKRVREALGELKKQASADGVIVVGLFGHGVEYERLVSGEKRAESYFCPFDVGVREAVYADGKPVFVKENQRAIEPDPESAVGMTEVFGALRLCKAGSRVLIADCCRNDPNAARGRGFGASVNVGDLPERTAALFSCSSQEKAFEDPQLRHGVFTYCLLERLKAARDSRQRVTAANLGEHLEDAVPELVEKLTSGRQKQTPRYMSLSTVDLRLRGGIARTELNPGPNSGKPSRPTDKPGEVITNSIGMKLVLIPAGEFLMGSPASDKDRSVDEGPQHQVKITKPFYLGMYEVTQAEYEAVMEKNPSYFSKSGAGSSKVSGMDTRDFPVEEVSWENASEFCRRLSARAGESGRVYRLPTEAQWEYTARAGSRTAFPWGDSLNGVHANCDGNRPYGTTTEGPYLDRTARKGSYTANAFGLYDMPGNVWEWCSDGYDRDYYSQSPPENPQNAATGSLRVIRGGGWHNYPVRCRSATRNPREPTLRGYSVGFRVVCAP